MDFLPLEIKTSIFHFLDDRSKLSARLTNTEWFEIIRYDDFVFYAITRDQMPSIIRRMAKYSHPIGITFKKFRLETTWRKSPSNTKQLADFFNMNVLTNLTRLDVIQFSKAFDWPISEQWILFTTLTNLQSFDVQDANQLSYRTLLPHFTNITRLVGVDETVNGFLTALKDLRSLDCKFGQDNTELFEYLTNTQKLTSLTIKYNGYMGTVKFDIDILTRLTNLKHLHWLNQFQIFPHSLLPNLESLILESTPDRLDLNTNLTQLRAYVDPLQTSALINLTKLVNLKISYGRNKILPMEYLTALQNLEELSLAWDNQISADLMCPYIVTTKLRKLVITYGDIDYTSSISYMTMLESLSFGKANNVYWLTCLTNLTMLEARNATDSSLVYLTKLAKLKYLDLIDGQFINLMNLVDLTNLEHLSLKMHTEAPYYIIGLESLTRLTYLTIVCNKKYDANGISKMTDLVHLNLSSTKAKGLWEHITALRRLKSIELKHLEGDENVVCLKQLSRLNRLVLRGTVATQDIMAFNHIYDFELH